MPIKRSPSVVLYMQQGSFPLMIFDGIGGSFDTCKMLVCISKVCCKNERMLFEDGGLPHSLKSFIFLVSPRLGKHIGELVDTLSKDLTGSNLP